jgi:hypothetical protein
MRAPEAADRQFSVRTPAQFSVASCAVLSSSDGFHMS